LLLALLSVLTSQTQAAMRVPTDGTFYPTEDQATLAISALQEECTSALGGGGSFSGSIYKEPVEYNQTTDTYSYLYYLQVSCNTCSSANQTKPLKITKVHAGSNVFPSHLCVRQKSGALQFSTLTAI
jgi:hypothetical protein